MAKLKPANHTNSRNVNPDISGFDAYTPEQVYNRIQSYNQSKMLLPPFKLIMLGILAGGYIGFGCLFYTFLSGNSLQPQAHEQIIAGLAFALGYVVALLAGSEVFTSNNLESMSWAAGKTKTTSLLKKWSIVLISNAIGAIGFGWLIHMTGILFDNNGIIVWNLIEISADMAHLDFQDAFFRGVLGNMIICIAIWVSFAGRSVTDKLIILALVISSITVLGFEHIVASFFYLPLAYSIMWFHPEYVAADMTYTIGEMLFHFAAIICGNIFGGTGMVALVYYIIYRA